MPANAELAPVLMGIMAVMACTPPDSAVDVRVPSGAITLSGTLYLPATPGPHPAVVIVHGSGSQTREPYVPFARAFAQRGIAALVYDKRGTGGSTGDWQHSPFSALADDGLAAIVFLAARAEIDSSRVGIWGGSEGGWIAPWVASRSKRVAFVIVQSAPVVDGVRQHLFQAVEAVRSAGGSAGDVEAGLDYVKMQHRYAATGEGFVQYARARDTNRSGILAMLGGPATPDDWWWAWSKTRMEFDPLRAWAGVSVPVLALWGSRDHNVPVTESSRLLGRVFQGSGNRLTTLIVYSELDHDLMPTGWRRLSTVARGLLRGTPGRTPSMDVMARWAADRFVTRRSR